MNLKQEAARKAMTFVKDKIIVGLGAGATIAYLIEFIKPEIENGLKVKLVTSSYSTLQLLLRNQLLVQQITSLSAIDIYFDGCDQVDKQLNALKSGGGIHTYEKLLASMAHEFIIIGDKTKLVDTFDTSFPLVVELLPEAAGFVQVTIQNSFANVRSNFRMNDKRDGPVITNNGNYLLDVWFLQWPELSQINPVFKNITGVVETSLFYKIAHKAIIADEDEIKVLKAN